MYREDNAANELKELATTAVEAARHNINRWRDRKLFPKMLDAATKATDRLDTETERRANEFAGIVLDDCLNAAQLPDAQFPKEHFPTSYPYILTLMEFDVSAREIPLKFAGEKGGIQEYFPDINSLDEGYRLSIEVDCRTKEDRDQAASKDPRDLIRDFRDGKTEGIRKMTVNLSAHQSVYTAREDNQPVKGIDKTIWTDEYKIEIAPMSSERLSMQIKRGYAYRQFAPYGYQDKLEDVFMPTQENADGSVSPIEEPQIQELRIDSPIKRIMDEAKTHGVVSYDDYEKRYGYGGEKDEVANTLLDLQHKQISTARERIGLIQGADSLLQQFLRRVKHGPKNLSQTVYIPFTPPDQEPADLADTEK